MDFLDNVKNVAVDVAHAAVDVAHVVAEKSGELVEATKVKYTIFELKSDIKKLYSEIGRLTYQAVEAGEDNTESVRMKCDIVTAKLAKIEALKSSSGMADFVCPNCGRKADVADTYCPSCGEDMTVDADVEVME